ncbi:MAG: putative quinol monooxygenase [Sciscionella sp.]
MCFTAAAGRSDELAELLVKVAEGLQSTPGCVYWLVARNRQAPDEIWVQELWATEDAAEDALAGQDVGGGPTPADVMALRAQPPQRTDLSPVGGVGYS